METKRVVIRFEEYTQVQRTVEHIIECHEDYDENLLITELKLNYPNPAYDILDAEILKEYDTDDEKQMCLLKETIKIIKR